MKRGTDIATRIPGLFIVHHNKPGLKLPSHSHSEHHLMIPVRGEIQVEVAAETHTLGPGKMIYIPADTDHRFLATNDKEGERIIALIDSKAWKTASAPKFPLSVLPVQTLAQEILFYLMLHPETPQASALRTTFVSVLVEAIGAQSNFHSQTTVAHLLAKARDERVVKAVRYLEDAYTETTGIPQVAKAAGLSSRNLTRLFSKEVGIGPKEALIRLRLEEAHRLLREDKLCVTEVAYRVGFGSLSRFIQSFQGLFGKLPSEVNR